MSSERVLVVNADDFGRSPAVNDGIRRAHEDGIVTSASLMVRWPDAADAAAYSRSAAALSLGLHIDLAEWEYVEDEWRPVYQAVDTDDAAAVSEEVDRQVTRFVALAGRPPTHLDSHQHVHRSEPVRSAVSRAGAALGVPVRDGSSAIRYCGAFYGQDGKANPVPEAITVDALVRLVTEVPAGVTELGCHPAAAADFDNAYARERVVELEVLCDPAVRAAIVAAGVQLRSFEEIGPASAR